MRKQEKALELDVVKQQMVKHCVSTRGKQELLQQHIVFDELWVTRELKRTKEAMDLLMVDCMPPLIGMKDIQEDVIAASKGRVLSVSSLKNIAQTIMVGNRVKRFYQEHKLEETYLGELMASLYDETAVAKQIDDAINVNCEIVDHASSELASIRKQIQQCLGAISKEIQRFIATHANALMDTQTTLRNNRTCVLVKISEKNNIKGFVHGESASGQTAYIEPESLLVLNNKLQSLKSREQEEIERILRLLSEQVQMRSTAIISSCETLELLDVIFAKAKWGLACNGCVAELSKDHLYLEKARHPLIDAKSVVANTYEIKKPYHSLLITGSNTGGKTVTLKTIGLFVAMTLCGFPVSASRAIVPFYTKLFTDIGDHQSIQESLSTFSSHVSALSAICEQANTSSLVLLDELGSGTDPKEGECLAVAVLDALRKKGAMVIATTHYSQLKSYAKHCDDILLSCVAFDMEKMRPTYRYMEGMSGQSNAFEIAARYHMDPEIIAHAKQLKQQMITKEERLMERLEQEQILLQQQKETMEQKLKEIKTLQEQLEKEKQKLNTNVEQILEEARKEAQEYLEQTKEEAQLLLEEVKQVQSDVKPHVISDLKQQIRTLGVKEEDELETEVEETFAVGDYVEIKKLHYFGEIIALNKGKAVVLTNGVKMNTKINDLKKAKKPQQKKTKSSYQKAIRSSFSMELNLIGMRVEEALAVLDKYLDNARLAKVYQVRIIHGMGTGALRNGVHQYLKRNTQVESYEMGGQGDGGLGATIVKLKQKGNQK